MAQQIRVGIVGCGAIAERNHLPGFSNVDGIEVVALCDVVPEKMQRLKQELVPAAELYADCAEMYRSAGLDAVAICTPNNLHYPQAMAAFEAGLHVLCEKPMAATLPEARRMIEAAAAAGKALQINQSLRYNAQYKTVVELVHEGAIGEVIHMRCLRAAGNTPNKGWSPGADWFVSSAAQGGLILDIAVHMADLMEWTAGKAQKVVALVDSRIPDIDVPDNVNAMFRYENGATGVLELSWTLPAGGGLFEVYGSKGRIRMGFSIEPIELTQIADGGKSETSHPTTRTGVKSSQQHFYQMLMGQGDSPTYGPMGWNALALCDAIAKSGKLGHFVLIEDF